MNLSTLFRLFIAGIFLSLLPIAIAAQNYGTGFDSYTSIDYDETTNTVMAYSETDADYELQGDYETIVILSVVNDSGAAVASGSQHDYWNGFAAVELDFAGEAEHTRRPGRITLI